MSSVASNGFSGRYTFDSESGSIDARFSRGDNNRYARSKLVIPAEGAATLSEEYRVAVGDVSLVSSDYGRGGEMILSSVLVGDSPIPSKDLPIIAPDRQGISPEEFLLDVFDIERIGDWGGMNPPSFDGIDCPEVSIYTGLTYTLDRNSNADNTGTLYSWASPLDRGDDLAWLVLSQDSALNQARARLITVNDVTIEVPNDNNVRHTIDVTVNGEVFSISGVDLGYTFDGGSFTHAEALGEGILLDRLEIVLNEGRHGRDVLQSVLNHIRGQEEEVV